VPFTCTFVPAPLARPCVVTPALEERRRQLVAMRTAEANRLAPALGPWVQQHIQTHLDWLDQQLAALDKEWRGSAPAGN
jgi:hypothetical protein